jgi:hypothetical protein
VLSAEDVEYIRSGFVELDELCSRQARDPAAITRARDLYPAIFAREGVRS